MRRFLPSPVQAVLLVAEIGGGRYPDDRPADESAWERLAELDEYKDRGRDEGARGSCLLIRPPEQQGHPGNADK